MIYCKMLLPSHRFLVDLYLGPNLLTSFIPTHIGLLDGLKQLYINDCSLNGTIPEEIGNLTNLGMEFTVARFGHLPLADSRLSFLSRLLQRPLVFRIMV